MFCEQCGSPILKSAGACPGCKNTLNSALVNSLISEWNSMYHAYVSVFPRTTQSFDELYDTFVSSGKSVSLIERAKRQEPEAYLELALFCNFSHEDAPKSVEFAEEALALARKANLNLGRYWFAYGCALQENNRPEDSVEAYTEALDCGFAEAALKLGFVVLQTQADLRAAVASWRKGTELGSELCKQKLQSVEDEPGVYSTFFEMPDGTMEFTAYSDKPGGLGNMQDLK